MKRSISNYLVFISLLIVVGAGMNQLLTTGQIRERIAERIRNKFTGFDKLLKKKPVINSNISEALPELPFLDDYNPEWARSLSILPRTQNGSFILNQPGHFIFEAQSYCLSPGKSSPSDDFGYLNAPLKGPWSGIVRNVLERSVNHPEIPQRDIQTLLWAIASRTRIKDMSRAMRITALKLLKPKELFKINGGALGLIPERLKDRIFEKLPPKLRKILEAEARLREMLTSAQATYEELEEIAVAYGDRTIDRGDREIPQGRWSFHPDGYFLRYSPRGYAGMLIELYVPEMIKIKKDDLGRIVSIEDDQGNKITSEYDDKINPLTIPGEPDLRGNAFSLIRFERNDPDNPEEQLHMEWTNSGWTFTGIPSGKGHIDSYSDRFADFKELYQDSIKHKQELDNLALNLRNRGGGHMYQCLNAAGLKHIMALGHYVMALKMVMGSNTDDLENWTIFHKDLVKRAWQSAICSNEATFGNARNFQKNYDNIERINGHSMDGNNVYAKWELFGFDGYPNQYGPSLVCEDFDVYYLSESSVGLGNQTSFNPSGGAGVSGDGDEQVEGVSGRPTKTQDDCVNENNQRMKQIEQDFYECCKKFEDPYDFQGIEICKTVRAIDLRNSWKEFSDCLK